MERGAKPDAFGPRRTVIELTFTDQIEKKCHWWFLNEAGQCELCLKAPDREADLFVETTLPGMIYIWRSDLPLAQALETQRLSVHGTGPMRRALGHWLGISPLAHVQSTRTEIQNA